MVSLLQGAPVRCSLGKVIVFDLYSRVFAGGDASSTEDFNPLWISEFKNTNAYEVWERTTDPLLFDIVEPRLVLGLCMGMISI